MQPTAHSPGTTAGLRAVGTAGHRPLSSLPPVDRLPSCPPAVPATRPHVFPVASRPPRSREGGRARGGGGRTRKSIPSRTKRTHGRPRNGESGLCSHLPAPRHAGTRDVVWCGAVGGTWCGVAWRGAALKSRAR
jgi:hypothetical protein